MASIKQLNVGGTNYDIKAKYDINGNEITSYYAPLADCEWVELELPASGWNNAQYTISDSRITANSWQEITPPANVTSEQLEILQAANIQDISQTTGSLVIKAFGDVPTVDVTIRVIFYKGTQLIQNAVGMDAIPTAGSTNAVQSNGIIGSLDTKVNKSGDTMTGDLLSENTDLGSSTSKWKAAHLSDGIFLHTNSTSSNDSGDIVWTYGDDSEKGRIWMDNDLTSSNCSFNVRSFDTSGSQLTGGSGKMMLTSEELTDNFAVSGAGSFKIKKATTLYTMPGHYYTNFYDDTGTTYIHNFPVGGNTKNCVTNFRAGYNGGFRTLSISGDGNINWNGNLTLTGALNTANNVWNKAGDDCYFGDNNTAGCFCLKGINGNTGIKFVQYNGTNGASLTYDGSKLITSAQITRPGAGSSWIAGRSNALISNTTYTGYNPILSCKTTNGSWELGPYNDNYLWLSYCTDTNYNAGTNTPAVQYQFRPNGTAVAASWTSSSSRNVKKNINIYTEKALDKIKNIDVVSFNYKTEKDTEQKHIGFIAEDTPEEFAGQKHDEMNLNNCIGMLLKAVQELSQEVEELKHANSN